MKFFDVFGIVFTDAEDIFRKLRQRGQNVYRGQRFGFHGLGLFVLFEGIGQGQQAFISLLDKFCQCFRKRGKERLF